MIEDIKKVVYGAGKGNLQNPDRVGFRFRIDSGEQSQAFWTSLYDQYGATGEGPLRVSLGVPGIEVFQERPTDAGNTKVAASSQLATGLSSLFSLGLIAFFVMYCKAVGTTGQFWGHRGAGVRIVDATTGGPIGAGRAFGRYFAHILDAIPCYLGFLWPLWDKRKQTFADKVTGTVSVRA